MVAGTAYSREVLYEQALQHQPDDQLFGTVSVSVAAAWSLAPPTSRRMLRAGTAAPARRHGFLKQPRCRGRRRGRWHRSQQRSCYEQALQHQPDDTVSRNDLSVDRAWSLAPPTAAGNISDHALPLHGRLDPARAGPDEIAGDSTALHSDSVGRHENALQASRFYGLLGPSQRSEMTPMRAIADEQLEGLFRQNMIDELKSVFVVHAIESEEQMFRMEHPVCSSCDKPRRQST